MKHFPLIWAGLWRKKTRTILTLLSILVAFLLFGLLQGINAGFEQAMDSGSVKRLLTFAAGGTPLPIAYVTQIEAIPGVRRVSYSARPLVSNIQQPTNMIIAMPVDPARWFEVYPELEMPKSQLEAFIATRTAAVGGVQRVERGGWKIGDQVPLPTTQPKTDGTTNWNFGLVGIFASPTQPAFEGGILINYDYFDEARATGKGTVNQFQVLIDDPAKAAEISIAIDSLFTNSSYQTRTQSEQEALREMISQIGDINFIVNAIIGAAFFTLLFLTGNTMMQSIRERVPEYAVLKTLGYTDAGVAALIFAETALLCGMGAAAGLMAALGVYPAAGAALGFGALSPAVLVAGAGAAAVVAVLASLPPMWRIRRLNIVDALAGR